MQTPLNTYVISLRSCLDRRREMGQRLSRLGLRAEFFDAVEGRSVDRARYPSLDPHSPLSDGELGCYLSHVALWQKVVAERIPHALILEDDVHLSPDLPAVCETLCSGDMPAYDLARLSSLQSLSGKVIRRIDARHTLILPTKDPVGTQGYLLSLQGAQHLLETLSRPRLPIDCELKFYWQHDLRITQVTPPVVFHDEAMASTILPTGRVDIVTSLRPAKRIARSIRKRYSLQKIYRQLTGKGWLSFLRDRYHDEG